MLKFGEWTPDLPDFENPGATQAKNVVPLGDSYGQFLGPTIYSGALDARCQGSKHGMDHAGNIYLFAGDSSKLYKIVATAWGDVSLAGGYNVSDETMWRFVQWGTQMLATQVGDKIQEFTMGTSTKFADLAAGAPQAYYIAVIRDFVVVANTYDASDGAVPHRVRWCGIGDPTDWTVSSVTQADYQDLNADNGWCMGIVGGEAGTIIQERAITRMSYVGSPSVFQFDEVETGRGTQAAGSICKIGNAIAFLGDDGFYLFDGNTSFPISTNKVSRYFYNDLDQSYYSRITSAVDPVGQVIYWSYPGAGNTAGTPNKVIMYNYASNASKKWSYAEIDHELIARLNIPTGYTLDDLDTIASSLDDLPFSLDSKAWIGNTVNLSVFNTDHKLCFLTGTALDAEIDTGEAEITPGGRTNVNKIRPLVDGSGTVTMQIGTRNTLAGTVTWSAEKSLNGSGDACIRSNARYHRARVKITGGFDHAQGVDIIEYNEAGKR